jgi:hypothetical protein
MVPISPPSSSSLDESEEEGEPDEGEDWVTVSRDDEGASPPTGGHGNERVVEMALS